MDFPTLWQNDWTRVEWTLSPGQSQIILVFLSVEWKNKRSRTVRKKTLLTRLTCSGDVYRESITGFFSSSYWGDVYTIRHSYYASLSDGPAVTEALRRRVWHIVRKSLVFNKCAFYFSPLAPPFLTLRGRISALCVHKRLWGGPPEVVTSLTIWFSLYRYPVGVTLERPHTEVIIHSVADAECLNTRPVSLYEQ